MFWALVCIAVAIEEWKAVLAPREPRPMGATKLSA